MTVDPHLQLLYLKLYSRAQKMDTDDQVPTGILLSSATAVNDTFSLRYRASDYARLLKEQCDHSSYVIKNVFFPLVSILLSRWLKSIKDLPFEDTKKVLVLVSGRGTPRCLTILSFPRHVYVRLLIQQ